MYRHRWRSAAVARSRTGVYVPVQDCGSCGTRRNPLTGAIVKRGGSGCWNAEVPPVDQVQVNAQLTRLQEKLRTLELSGERVSWDHGSKARSNEHHPGFL